nr:MAG TPA: hypothetical protein [Caudoviricetes sp.]DAZ14281.1 MAG TPA: hypothetical protein [Caudoviricetes sp.]
MWPALKYFQSVPSSFPSPSPFLHKNRVLFLLIFTSCSRLPKVVRYR